MKKIRWPLRIYIIMMALVAVIFGAVSWQNWPLDLTLNQLVLAVAFVILTAIASHYPIPISPRVKVTVATSVIFAAILLFGTPLALLSSAIGVAIANIGLKRSWYNTLFNVSQTALYAGLAGLVYHSLVPSTASMMIEKPENIFAIPLAAIVVYFTNTIAVSIAVGLQLGVNPLELWMEDRKSDLAQESALILLGLLAALIVVQYPWTIFLMVIPVAVVHKSFKNATQLRTQTRQALESMADVIDMRDPHTFAHSQRVAELSKEIANKMGLSRETVNLICSAARIHDLGKIGIDANILLKPSSLNDAEWQQMRKHPEVGASILEKFRDYKAGMSLILYHHERYNGSGYPKGLEKDRIPLGARIIAVADAYDAMCSDRPYRKGLPLPAVVEELQRNRAIQFDPAVVDALLAVVRQKKDKQTQPTLPTDVRTIATSAA